MKVKCIKEGHSDFFKLNKVYDFNDGVIIDDEGHSWYGETLDLINLTYVFQFEEVIKEESDNGNKTEFKLKDIIGLAITVESENGNKFKIKIPGVKCDNVNNITESIINAYSSKSKEGLTINIKGIALDQNKGYLASIEQITD